MDFLVNDLSLHGQYASSEAFLEALDVILGCRAAIQRNRHALRCHRELSQARATGGDSFRDIVRRHPDLNKRRAILSWLDKDGPFWDDDPVHGAQDSFEYGGQSVTSHALGEAAALSALGPSCALVSFSPSPSYNHTPLPVDWKLESAPRQTINVRNFWQRETLRQYLLSLLPPVQSWQALHEWVERNCLNLTLARDATEELLGHPFVPGAAERMQALLLVLDRMKTCFYNDGRATEEWHQLHDTYFTRKNAYFTDSSDTEKREFAQELTFRHPERPGETLFCPYHGKVRTGVHRIHFTWPMTKDNPLYVVYIGPKRTKR